MSKRDKYGRCPDCGYLIRGLSDACTECGLRFPSSPRICRRWAIRRLPFEGRFGLHVVLAYFATILLIVFRPCAAARRIAIADRYGRAILWCVLHILLVPTILILHSDSQAIAAVFMRPGSAPSNETYFSEPVSMERQISKRLTWIRGALVGSALLAAAPVLVGVLLCANFLFQHPLMKLSAIKWSLYASAILPVATVGWLVHDHQFPRLFLLPGPITVWALGPARPVPAIFLGIVYGAWWSFGILRNPYLSWFNIKLRPTISFWRKISIPFVGKVLAEFIGCWVIYSLFFWGLAVSVLHLRKYELLQ